jgi:hypothetical protein
VEPCLCTSHDPDHGGRFFGIVWPLPLFCKTRGRKESSCYNDRDARRFKAERDETRHELEIISKDAGIAELEWEHQRKQLLEAIDGESCNPLNLNSILN